MTIHRMRNIGIALFCLAGAAQAQQLPVAYPANGQSQEQQQADKSACMSWAQSNAPVQAGPAPQTGPAVGGGQRVGGAMRGAAAGAVVGGVANNDAGHGAAVGAAAGVVAGGMRAREQRREQNAAAAATQNQNAANQAQAYGACMKGKGYTVN
ncbi:Glycine-zipper containing OmpA-like membrane domain-containing protein [Dyella jiangningensis]|uniref:glycine zipper domain-containing protein n=1 Tax=Dyella sp. AtDHG13 TaxID=1938897 RepID=UPI00089210AF|nr:glycine zipper domain-containing protein [Dyella sp. AtDHG13]PXV60585.1 YmgG-like glycine-zipper protein [Dyella sp. AtDHG13]SDJ51259.1 Glycine-zipper containing OmpA-like membrane domain-containing protein [Dyella jiangningensis]